MPVGYGYVDPRALHGYGLQGGTPHWGRTGTEVWAA